MNDLDSQNVRCSWKHDEKLLRATVARKEKLCAQTKQKLEEEKLAFECNLASSTTSKVNEGKSKHQSCLVSRMQLYSTPGKNYDG